MVGRPSKLTPERAQAIALAVSEGHYLQHAAVAAGVARSSVHSWLARGQKARERLDGGGEPEPDEEPYLDLLEALEWAEKCAAELGIAPIRTAMADWNWRAAAWYLERRFPGHWRPGADRDAGDEEDAAATYAIDPAAGEELLAKLKRIAEVNEARAAEALQQAERELDALRPGDYSPDDWDKLKEHALRPLRALFQQDGQSLIARAVGPPLAGTPAPARDGKENTRRTAEATASEPQTQAEEGKRRGNAA